MVIKFNEVSSDTTYLNIKDNAVQKQDKIINRNKKQEEKEIEREKSDSVTISKEGKGLSIKYNALTNDRIKELNSQKEDIKEKMKEYQKKAEEENIDDEIVKEQMKQYEEQLAEIDKQITEEKKAIIEAKNEEIKRTNEKINSTSDTEEKSEVEKQNEKANDTSTDIIDMYVSYDSARTRTRSLNELAVREDIQAKSYEPGEVLDGDPELAALHKSKAQDLRDISMQQLAKGYKEVSEISSERIDEEEQDDNNILLDDEKEKSKEQIFEKDNMVNREEVNYNV